VKKIFFALVLVFFVIFTSGCAVMNFYGKIDKQVEAGQYAEADKIIDSEKDQYKGLHELLYYFDKGSVLQMMGDYSGSTAQLEKAELKIDSLYTKSATQQASSFFTNDLNLPYEGEDFEQVMVNTMKCLNFLYQGDFEGAEVEAKKVNNRLNLLNDKYEGKEIYKDDAFSRYLSALSYEARGDYNDAFIDYKKSYEDYKQYAQLYGTPVPERVQFDILRMAEASRFYDEVDRFKKEFNIVKYPTYADGRVRGEVIFVIYDGMSAFKVNKFIDAVAVDKNSNPHVIKVAFPEFRSRGYVVNDVQVDGMYDGFDAEDITSIAITNLEHKNGLIKLKAIARATAKYLAGRAVSNNGQNQLLSIVADVYNYASEQADTRCWRTLPARFRIVRLQLPQGKHTIQLALKLTNGTDRPESFDVNIKAGQKKIIPVFAFN
jgi:hypothetical protein